MAQSFFTKKISRHIWDMAVLMPLLPTRKRQVRTRLIYSPTIILRGSDWWNLSTSQQRIQILSYSNDTACRLPLPQIHSANAKCKKPTRRCFMCLKQSSADQKTSTQKETRTCVQTQRHGAVDYSLPWSGPHGGQLFKQSKPSYTIRHSFIQLKYRSILMQRTHLFIRPQIFEVLQCFISTVVKQTSNFFYFNFSFFRALYISGSSFVHEGCNVG